MKDKKPLQERIFWLLVCWTFSSLLFTTAEASAFISHPPKGWEHLSDPEQLPQKVKEIYIGGGTGNNSFTPSLNVAVEETALPLSEYAALAKSYHEKQGGTRCQFIGKIKTEFGPAELLQIDRRSQWGEIRFIQAMLVYQGSAYVVTGTCLKAQFASLSSQMFKAIQSLKINDARLQEG